MLTLIAVLRQHIFVLNVLRNGFTTRKNLTITRKLSLNSEIQRDDSQPLHNIQSSYITYPHSGIQLQLSLDIHFPYSKSRGALDPEVGSLAASSCFILCKSNLLAVCIKYEGVVMSRYTTVCKVKCFVNKFLTLRVLFGFNSKKN